MLDLPVGNRQTVSKDDLLELELEFKLETIDSKLGRCRAALLGGNEAAREVIAAISS